MSKLHGVQITNEHYHDFLEKYKTLLYQIDNNTPFITFQFQLKQYKNVVDSLISNTSQMLVSSGGSDKDLLNLLSITYKKCFIYNNYLLTFQDCNKYKTCGFPIAFDREPTSINCFISLVLFHKSLHSFNPFL